MAYTLDKFERQFLKRDGDLKDRSVQRWHLSTDFYASGVFASGIFDYIRIDGPTTPGYVLTADSEGWGTWQSAATTFLDLTDTPNSYATYSASGIRVNAGENN